MSWDEEHATPQQGRSSHTGGTSIRCGSHQRVSHHPSLAPPGRLAASVHAVGCCAPCSTHLPPRGCHTHPMLTAPPPPLLCAVVVPCKFKTNNRGAALRHSLAGCRGGACCRCCVWWRCGPADAGAEVPAEEGGRAAGLKHQGFCGGAHSSGTGGHQVEGCVGGDGSSSNSSGNSGSSSGSGGGGVGSSSGFWDSRRSSILVQRHALW